MIFFTSPKQVNFTFLVNSIKYIYIHTWWYINGGKMFEIKERKISLKYRETYFFYTLIS